MKKKELLRRLFVQFLVFQLEAMELQGEMETVTKEENAERQEEFVKLLKTIKTGSSDR